MSRQSTLAYETVRSWILNGQFEPGQRLVEEELARNVGVSRTSIRDCVRRLAADGLVRSEANRGTFVLQLGTAEVDEVFQLRALLEGQGASLAAQQSDLAYCDELAVTARQIDELLEGPRVAEAELYARFQSLNTHFHLTLVGASHSPRLETMARSLIELPLVTLKQHAWPGEVSVRRSNAQHWEIIDALRAGDAVLARLCIQSHILSARPRAMVASASPAAPL